MEKNGISAFAWTQAFPLIKLAKKLKELQKDSTMDRKTGFH